MLLAVIDMQKVFITDKKSPWADSDLLSIVPNIKSLCNAIEPQRTIFTQFAPPVDWQSEYKSWRTYYYYNRGVTTEVVGTESIEIIDEFIPVIGDPATRLATKKAASAFSSDQFKSEVERDDPLFLVIVGIETDYCVLSTALDAVNQGYYVVIPTDACASSNASGQANAEGIFKRFREQLWITDTNSFLSQIGKCGDSEVTIDS